MSVKVLIYVLVGLVSGLISAFMLEAENSLFIPLQLLPLAPGLIFGIFSVVVLKRKMSVKNTLFYIIVSMIAFIIAYYVSIFIGIQLSVLPGMDISLFSSPGEVQSPIIFALVCGGFIGTFIFTLGVFLFMHPIKRYQFFFLLVLGTILSLIPYVSYPKTYVFILFPVWQACMLGAIGFFINKNSLLRRKQ